MMKLRACTLILTALCVCATSWAADEPKPGQLKPGWSDRKLYKLTEGCADAIVKPAIQAYQDRVTASGRTDAKPFPEKELRESALPMCECISRRLAETWTPLELADPALERSKPFIEEALRGGQCKPGGMLGEMLKRDSESKPD